MDFLPSPVVTRRMGIVNELCRPFDGGADGNSPFWVTPRPCLSLMTYYIVGFPSLPRPSLQIYNSIEQPDIDQ